MNSLFTIALMFKVLDQATAPVRKINETLDATGRNLDKAAGKSAALNRGIDRMGAGAGMAGRLAIGVDRIGKAAEAATAKLNALHAKAEKLGTSAEKLTGLGTPMAAVGAVGALGIGKTIQDFTTLEEAQIRLKTNLMDQTGKVGPEFEKLGRLAEKLGVELPGSTKDMLEMFTALREQGVQTNVILGGMGEAAAKFAVIMKVPYAEAATHVAKFAEAMGIADKDAVGFMDILQRLKSAGGVNVTDLAESFKYSGAALKALRIQGMGAGKDVSAAIGMMATSSIEGSQAGTNFAMALSRMAEISHKLETKKIKELVGPILDAKGIKLNFFDGGGNFVGIRGMIREMEKLRAINPQEQLLVLSKLFGQEAARPLSVFINQGVAGFDEMNRRMAAQADMQAKIKEIMEGTTMQWDTMTGTVQTLRAHLGGVFAKLINLPGILTRLNNLFGKMDSFVLLHPKTAGIIAGIVLAVTGLSLAGGTLLLTIAGLGAAVPRALEALTVLGKGATWATGRITSLYLAMRRKWVFNRLPDSMFGDVIPGAAKAQAGIRGVIAATRAWAVANLFTISGLRALSVAMLSNPIGWIALAIGVAALIIYKYWKPISGFFRGLWAGLKEGLKGLEPAWDIFKKVAPMIFPIIIPLKWIFNAVKALFKPVDDVGGKAESMGLRFGRAIGGILSAVLQLPARMLTAGANIVESLFKGMMGKIEKPINAMKGLAQRLRNFLPFSPAKEGPLRDINRVRIVETIAESMKPQPLVTAMKGVTAAAMIAATPVSSLARPAAPMAGGSGMVVHFSPQITIQGGGSAEQVKGQVGEAMKLSFVEFERMMKRYEENRTRKTF